MYYLGYLTIAGQQGHETIFQIPNQVIQELYWEYFAELITKREQLPYEDRQIRAAVRELVQGEVKPFLAMIEAVLGILSNRDYQDFDEKYIKMLIIAYVLFAQTHYIPVSEREASQEGYMDLLLLAPPNLPIEYEYFFELKYIKKAEAGEKVIKEAQKKAKEQALRYLRADATLRDKPKLRAFTLVFVKNQLLVEQVAV
ncbi:MAG: hypothetical protein HC912_00070 [Saprospiraceae bacterium]|nr:hypothetical protein [Saprospiraceae bacterium]